MTELSMAAGPARALFDFAVSRGAERAALTRQSGIDPAQLEDQDNRIPFARYVALMRAAKEHTGDPALALRFGEAVDMSEISILGLLGPASQTMRDAFAQLNRYARLVVEVDLSTAERFQLTPGEGGLWLVDARLDPNDFPELTESTFARMVCGIRRIAAGHGVAQAPVRAVHVTHAAPAYRAEYDRILGAPVTFASERNAILLDEIFLSQRVPLQSRYVFGVLSERAEGLLKNLESAKSTRARVEGLLMPLLHKGDIGMAAVAEKMRMSRWTLSRKLKAEGVTFERVLDGLRHKMALHYLSGKKVSVNETAHLVGFSETAAFSRAFKRWTGSSPRKRRG
jgi:AraC-like DNA-binding protein